MTCVGSIGKRKNNATVQLNSFDNCNASLVEDEEWVGEQASYHTLFVRVAYNDGRRVSSKKCGTEYLSPQWMN